MQTRPVCFSGIQTVAKRIKRIGLLFSGIRPIDLKRGLRYEVVPDIERQGVCFSDGCGLHHPKFGKEVARFVDVKHRGGRYWPSVYQVGANSV